MDNVLIDLPFLIAYIDDIGIASEDEIEHEKHIKMVFERLRKHGLRINIDKCEFFQSSITFLGHKIDAHTTRENQSFGGLQETKIS